MSNSKFHIKKGDRVIAITGKDKGKTGVVLKVYPKNEKVLVQGINFVKRHQKLSAKAEAGILEIESPMHISNVAHIDPESGKPTKVGTKVVGDRVVLFSRKSGLEIRAKN